MIALCPRLVCVIYFVSLLMISTVTQAVTSIDYKKETAYFLMDIEYPQGFDKQETNAQIHAVVEHVQNTFLQQLAGNRNQPEADKKSTLHIRYTIPFQSPDVTSVCMETSAYQWGDAHPENHIITKNFLQGQLLQLEDVFNESAEGLKSIAVFCAQAMGSRHISTQEEINEGTAPRTDNYQNWVVTPQGLNIIFDPYQVAAGAYGAQTVSIPYAVLAPQIKSDLQRKVWLSE